MTQIILPPNYPEISGDLIFLAGPIQGAQHWQNQAIQILDGQVANIASPRRPDESWHNDFEAQVDWETYHLAQASCKGAIVFWCAKESEHRCDRAYAQTTRFEFGEWFTHWRNGYCLNLVLGIEPGFSGAKYFRRRVGAFPIWETLQETCQAALNLLRR